MFIAVLSLGLGAAVSCVPDRAPLGEKIEAAKPTFTLLFNGKNLDGWQPKGIKVPLTSKTDAFDGRFKVVEGVLVYNGEVKGDRFLETTREFAKDVHVKFDFKPGPRCNNDVFFRGVKFDIVPGINRENAAIKEGEWSTFELVAKGDTIAFKINGTTVRTTQGRPATPSPFVLRAEFGAMEVRNILVKE